MTAYPPDVTGGWVDWVIIGFGLSLIVAAFVPLLLRQLRRSAAEIRNRRREREYLRDRRVR